MPFAVSSENPQGMKEGHPDGIRRRIRISLFENISGLTKIESKPF